MLVGYPSFVIYLILGVGTFLALGKPFKSFIIITFILSSANSEAFTNTRTPLLGPYMNANDACLVILLLSTFSYIFFHKKKIKFPPMAIWILLILLLSYLQSVFSLGYSYESLRAFRWGITLPLFMTLSACMVDRIEKIKPLVLAIFWGSIVSASEHILHVQGKMSSLEDASLEQIRTIAFRSPGLWLLLAGIVLFPKNIGLKKNIMVIGGGLFAMSIILNQTRSIWIASAVSLPILFVLFPQKHLDMKVLKIPFMLIVLFLSITLVGKTVLPGVDPTRVIGDRLKTLSSGEVKRKKHDTTITRVIAFRRETEEWKKGTLIFGRGLWYFGPMYHEKIGGNRVAWNHLGHITILAQCGLIGLFIYSFALPFSLFRDGKTLWKTERQDLRFMALLSSACILVSWMTFVMSDSFLTQHAVEGIVFGVAWRIADNLRGENKKKTEKGRREKGSLIPAHRQAHQLQIAMGRV